MQFLWQTSSQGLRYNASQKRRHRAVVLFTKMQKEHVGIEARPKNVKVDKKISKGRNYQEIISESN